MQSKSHMEQIKIYHHNTNGLNKSKLKYYISLLEQNLSIIVFISETWFTDAHHQAKKSKWFVAESLQTPKRTIGHKNGGIICLCSTSLIPFTSTITNSEFSITIRMHSSEISTVYFPPSLNPKTCESITDSIITSDIIVGDINTRFGALYGDNRRGPLIRNKIFSKLLDLDFAHPIPSGQKCPLDHCFLKSYLNFHLKAFKSPIMSDHPNILELSLQLKTNTTHNLPVERTIKFNVHYLKNSWIRKLLINSYDSMAGLINILFENDELNHDVDMLDKFLLEYVQTACEVILGIKNPETMDYGKPVQLSKIISECSNLSAIKTFKQSLKCQKMRIPCSENAKSPIEETESFYKDLYTQRANHLKTCRKTNHPIEYKLSDEEILEEIRKYPGGKSCGEDGIHISILKTLSNSKSFVSNIRTLFQACFTSGKTPTRWNYSIIYPIPKNKNPSSIEDFRPISLTVMFRRIFEKIILKRIENLNSCKLNIGQAGFRSGFSTITQIIASNLRSFNRNCIRVFLDLKQAYDRTPVPVVLELLRKRGLHNGFISIISSLYSGCKTKILVNGVFTKHIELERGLLQGGILSPFLFSIFIDPLAESMNCNFPSNEFPALLFADDIQIVHFSREVIQECLDITWKWINNNGMEINVKKSGNISEREFQVGPYRLPRLRDYKYLGFPHNSKGIDIESSIALRSSKTKSILELCQGRGHSWPIWVKLIIFKTFIRPACEYGLGLIYKSLLKNNMRKLNPIENLYKESVAWISNMSKKSHKTACYLLGIETFQLRCDVLASQLARHLDTMDESNHLRAVFSKSKGDLFLYDRIQRLRDNNLYNNWKLSVGTSKIPFSVFLKQFFMNKLAKALPKIGSSIPKTSRNPKETGPIRVVYFETNESAKNLFQWRGNSFGTSLTCVCGKVFNRGHMTSCFKISSIFITGLIDSGELRTAASLLKEVKKVLRPKGRVV